MRLDIALVRCRGPERPLDHFVGGLESSVEVAMAELALTGDVLREPCWHILLHAALVQNRRARLHRCVDIGDVGQNLICSTLINLSACLAIWALDAATAATA